MLFLTSNSINKISVLKSHGRTSGGVKRLRLMVECKLFHNHFHTDPYVNVILNQFITIAKHGQHIFNTQFPVITRSITERLGLSTKICMKTEMIE